MEKEKTKEKLKKLLFREVKEYKLYLLIIIIVFMAFFFGMISYAIFSTELYGTNTITFEVDLSEELDNVCFEYDEITQNDVNSTVYLTNADLGKIRITDYLCYTGNTDGLDVVTSVNIPAMLVEYGLDLDIVDIAVDSFKNKGITSITLPSGLKYIGNEAFRGNSLTTLTIPADVTYLGSSAFKDNTLTTVVLPSSITSINEGAFFKSTTSNPNLVKITNASSNSFDWKRVILEVTSFTSPTGFIQPTSGSTVYIVNTSNNFEQFIINNGSQYYPLAVIYGTWTAKFNHLTLGNPITFSSGNQNSLSSASLHTTGMVDLTKVSSIQISFNSITATRRGSSGNPDGYIYSYTSTSTAVSNEAIPLAATTSNTVQLVTGNVNDIWVLQTSGTINHNVSGITGQHYIFVRTKAYYVADYTGNIPSIKLVGTY